MKTAVVFGVFSFATTALTSVLMYLMLYSVYISIFFGLIMLFVTVLYIFFAIDSRENVTSLVMRILASSFSLISTICCFCLHITDFSQILLIGRIFFAFFTLFGISYVVSMQWSFISEKYLRNTIYSLDLNTEISEKLFPIFQSLSTFVTVVILFLFDHASKQEMMTMILIRSISATFVSTIIAVTFGVFLQSQAFSTLLIVKLNNE